MKLSVQEGLLPGDSFGEKLDHAAAYGFDGIEPGGAALLDRLDEVTAALENHPVKLSTICSGYRGSLVDASKAERDQAVGDITRLLEVGGQLGAVGLICVPCFGGPKLPDLSPWRNAETLELDLVVDLLGPLAEVAQKAECLLLVEPLNRYETHLLKRLSDAVEVVERVGRPGVAIMADLFHMNIEEDDTPAAIRSAGAHIRHVHLADNQRLQPGTGVTDFRAAFEALREIGFKDYMALECGIRGDRANALQECASYLREQMG